MMAKICPLSNQAVVYLECNECDKRNDCRKGNLDKPVESKLVILLEEEIGKRNSKNWKKETCSMCKYCHYAKTIRISGCDVALYQCQNEKSKKYGSEMDEFHTARKACEEFDKE